MLQGSGKSIDKPLDLFSWDDSALRGIAPPLMQQETSHKPNCRLLDEALELYHFERRSLKRRPPPNHGRSIFT